MNKKALKKRNKELKKSVHEMWELVEFSNREAISWHKVAEAVSKEWLWEKFSLEMKRSEVDDVN